MTDTESFEIPYDELDDNIVKLVRCLNNLPGILTLSSCGGHHRPKLDLGQWRDGTWYVQFVVDHTEAGWKTLEFLAWAVNIDYRGGPGQHVIFVPKAPPPHEHGPGEVLSFFVEGYTGSNPDQLAEYLESVRDYYGKSPE